MRIILTFVTLLMLAVVVNSDWVKSDRLGPKPDLDMPRCLGCI